MMAGTRLEGMRAVGAAHPARRAGHDRRSFVVRLVGDDARRRVIGMLVPGALELGAVTHWTIALEEFAILADISLDEIIGRVLEHWLPLLGVGIQKRGAAPAVQRRRDLPAEIDDVIKPAVEPIGAVRRMAVGGIARDEGVSDLVLLGDRNAQIRAPHIDERTREGKPGRALPE